MNYNYLMFPKSTILPEKIGDIGAYDLLLTTYSTNDRVSFIGNNLSSKVVVKLVFNELQFHDVKENNIFSCDTIEENIYISKLLKYLEETYSISTFETLRIAIDLTGFVTPYLFFLLLSLYQIQKVKEIGFFYTEPIKYLDAEYTEFLQGNSESRPIKGFSMGSDMLSEDALLILGTGYDRSILQRINNQETCKKHYVFGLPSTQPDMYFQNIFNVYSVDKSIASLSNERKSYASATDPFHNAFVLDEIVTKESSLTNVKLCPIGSKPQALGFFLYYLINHDKGTHKLNVIFPYSDIHNSDCSAGISRVWRYQINKSIAEKINTTI